MLHLITCHSGGRLEEGSCCLGGCQRGLGLFGIREDTEILEVFFRLGVVLLGDVIKLHGKILAFVGWGADWGTRLRDFVNCSI